MRPRNWRRRRRAPSGVCDQLRPLQHARPRSTELDSCSTRRARGPCDVVSLVAHSRGAYLTGMGRRGRSPGLMPPIARPHTEGEAERESIWWLGHSPRRAPGAGSRMRPHLVARLPGAPEAEGVGRAGGDVAGGDRLALYVGDGRRPGDLSGCRGGAGCRREDDIAHSADADHQDQKCDDHLEAHVTGPRDRVGPVGHLSVARPNTNLVWCS